MIRKSLVVFLVCASLALAISLFAAVDIPKRANLSAAAIVGKNIEARGGLQAWRAVQTISLAGEIGGGGEWRGWGSGCKTEQRGGREAPPFPAGDGGATPFFVEV